MQRLGERVQEVNNFLKCFLCRQCRIKGESVYPLQDSDSVNTFLRHEELLSRSLLGLYSVKEKSAITSS
jgi:hypothetical protein